LGRSGLIGFFYNIPNNTLPIFWSDKYGWFPLFKRYESKKLIKNAQLPVSYNNDIIKSYERYILSQEIMRDGEFPASGPILESMNKRWKIGKISLNGNPIYLISELSIIYSLINGCSRLDEISELVNLPKTHVTKIAAKMKKECKLVGNELLLRKYTPKIVVFDWSYTLAEEYDLDEAICNFIPYANDENKTTYLKNIIKFREMLADYERDKSYLWYDYIKHGEIFGKSEADMKVAHFRNRSQIKPLCNFPELAFKLKSKGIKVAIATNCVEKVFKWRSEILGWPISECVDYFVTSDKIKKIENKIPHIGEICRISGIRPEDILFVSDDFDKDILPAKSIGCNLTSP